MSRFRALARAFRLPGVSEPPAAPEPAMEHDAAEAEAMAEHYAAPAGPVLPQPDPLAQGLARGFRTQRGGRPE